MKKMKMADANTITAALVIAAAIGSLQIFNKTLEATMAKFYTISPGSPGFGNLETIAIGVAGMFFVICSAMIIIIRDKMTTKAEAAQRKAAELKEKAEKEAERLFEEKQFLENVMHVRGFNSFREYNEAVLRRMKARHIDDPMSLNYESTEALWDDLLETAETGFGEAVAKEV